ncbi:Serine/threonine-protein kinase SCH9 [Erysiphe necator]|nr:Serine/threonine-protein kinase SCH9 [Erysiphe necator]
MLANYFSGSQDVPKDSESGNQTPRSGIPTPQPDPVDRRLPGIEHSYFGQVCYGSSTHPSLDLLEPFALKSSDKSHLFLNSPRKLYSGEVLSLVATDSTVKPGDSVENKAPTKTVEKSQSMVTYSHSTSSVTLRSSLQYLKSNSSLAEKNISKSLNSKRPLMKYSTYPISMTENSPTIRRLSMAPLSSIITALHISALMSNPSDNCKPVSSGTSSHSCLSSEFCKSPPIKQLKQLTKPFTEKSISVTPARTLSNRTCMSDATIGSDSDDRQEKFTPSDGSKNEPTPLQTPVTTASAPPARGRLIVKISKARGLRKSRHPYVLAVFQRSELFSNGPISEDEDQYKNHMESLEVGGIPVVRSSSDSKPMVIPMKSRQSSNTSTIDHPDVTFRKKNTINPHWETKAIFDVVGSDPSIHLTIYDRGLAADEFLGHTEFQANLTDIDSPPFKGWLQLQGKNDKDCANMGEIYVEVKFQPTRKRHYGPEDFQFLKLIGKGTFGQVYQVRKKDTGRIYAMKVLQKKVIVQKKEVAHTVGERNILVRTAMAESQFIVGLKFSFQTPSDLYLVTDYMSGGELFWHLQREGRFCEERAKFYIAELILALQHLHKHDIVYRDLKPENILLDANGHIALCDFGLSKANLTKNETTNTFCGTTEYLAPEVLLDETGYTKMVDFWSLGVLVFEMCCGWSPFYAEDTQQMYKNIAFGKVRFPRDTLTTEGRNFVKGLLNRNPKHRLGAIDDAEELKRHPFFADIDWDLLAAKKITPLFKPQLDSETDTSNFDPEFTNALNGDGPLNDRAAALAAGIATSTPLSPGMQANFKGFTFVDESSMDENMAGIGSRNDWESGDDYDIQCDEDFSNL